MVTKSSPEVFYSIGGKFHLLTVLPNLLIGPGIRLAYGRTVPENPSVLKEMFFSVSLLLLLAPLSFDMFPDYRVVCGNCLTVGYVCLDLSILLDNMIQSTFRASYKCGGGE